MKYKIQSYFPSSGRPEDPGIVVEVKEAKSILKPDNTLASDIYDCMVNDYRKEFGIGHQVIITRIE